MNSEYYIGQIFEGVYPSDAATWVDRNNAQIVEIGSVDGMRIYEIQPAPEVSVDQKKARVRSVRDGYIVGIEWRVSRYRDQKEMEIETSDDFETYHKILEYMQYLRDYPKSSETWYEHDPLTFNEWCGIIIH